jgi:hypothetical protein
MTTPIHIPWNQNLGDQWQTISLMLHRAENVPTLLSTRQNGTDLGPLQRAILRQYAHADQVPLVLVDLPGDTPLSGYDVWRCPPWPTWQRWDGLGMHTHVCVQWAGESTPELKNCPSDDIHHLTAWIDRHLGLPIVLIDRALGISASVRALSRCALFLGIDAAGAHMAHSVGCPVFLLQYQLPVVTCHRGRAYTLCEGAADAIDKLSRWRDYRRFIGA